LVFSIDHESKKIIGVVQNEGNTEEYECIVSACENPVCTCGSVYLELIPLKSKSESAYPLLPHRVCIDLDNEILEHKGKTPVDDLDFAKLLLSELDKNDFRLLHEKRFEFKNRITETCSVDSIDAYFDYCSVERDGLMSAYNDILPYGNQLFVTIENKQYMIFDQFCLLPKCSCTDATLSILAIDAFGKTGEELGSVSVNYRKREWKKVEDDLYPFSTGTLKSVIETQVPDIYKQLLARHIRIKAIYAHCKKRHYSRKEPLELPKVGRNDPCPCGSGKKHKKCCLGKAS
jgi:hypothetical protein